MANDLVPLPLEDMTEQKIRVEIGTRDEVPQFRSSSVSRFTDCGQEASSRSPSLLACSDSDKASISGSRSPSIIPGRLCKVAPIL